MNRDPAVTADLPVRPGKRWLFGQVLLTGLCGATFTLVLWVALASLLQRRIPHGYDQIAWAVTLWLSAVTATFFVARSRHAVRPVLGCTGAFGLFAIGYMACEGPIFGAVAQGGDPAATNFVVWNLICLPLGVFAATECARRLSGRRNGTQNAA